MPSHSRTGGDQQQVWLWRCSAGTAEHRTGPGKKITAPCHCPMQDGVRGWASLLRVCVGRLHAIPAGQAPASLISAGSRPNGWAAWVPLVIAIAEQNLQSGQALEAHCPVSIRWNRETAKVWSPGSSTVRPRAREHPGGIIQGTSAAAPQCAPPALPRAAP